MVQSNNDHRALLMQCSVLRCFDRDVLRAVLNCDAAAADSLLAGPEIEALANGYRLRPDVALVAREQLLAAGTEVATALHQQAFAFYLARLQQRRDAQRTLDDEDECLYHLDALFVPLLNQMQWQTMRRYAVQVLRIRPERLGHRQRLLMFAGYSAVHLQKYARGEKLLTDLLAHESLEPDVRYKALKGLVDSSWFRSRYGEALERYERLHKAALDTGDLVYQGVVLLNRSIVFHELQQYDLALGDCEQSLVIFRELGDQTRAAYALYHAALFTLHLGRWDAARQYSSEAAIQFERLGLQAHLGFILWCQGLLAHIFGDESASEAAYLRALAIAEASVGEQLSLALDVCVNIGILYHAYGKYQLALDYYDRALFYAARLDRPHQLCLIHFRRGQVFELLARPGKAFLAYRTAISYIERMSSATTREDVKISLLGTTQQIYEAMVLLCRTFFEQNHSSSWIERALNYVERARSRAFLDALAHRAPDIHAVSAETAAPVQLSEIQASLPDDALLIEYFTTGVLPRGEHLIARIPAGNRRLRDILTLPPRILAFTISRDRCELFAPSLDPNRLRPQIGDYHPGRHLLLGPMPLMLYEQLIAPAARLLADKHLLYLVPHGPLHYVPFAALRTPAGTSLLDLSPTPEGGGLSLAHAPSATILVRNCLVRRPARGGKALVIGFNDPQGTQPLRFAEAEAEHIARLLDGHAWTGPQPKREGLRNVGKELSCLHIAGHALFTPRDPLGSWLLLGQNDQLSAREIIDGIDLGAELVTLSSCTSGISHVVPGDELLGLPRALLYAGAATVVCTRWEAFDVVALLVMDRFYAELPHHSPAVALRNAQVAVRELTVEQLSQIFAGWIAQGGALAAAISDSALLLNELSLVSRQALAIADAAAPGGQAADQTQSLQFHEPVAPLNPGAQPFTAPLFWAPFMVIGRA